MNPKGEKIKQSKTKFESSIIELIKQLNQTKTMHVIEGLI